MSVVELHAEVLFLLLRINDAPTLSRDGSIDGLAGRGGSNCVQLSQRYSPFGVS
jgi:hypothetical protein